MTETNQTKAAALVARLQAEGVDLDDLEGALDDLVHEGKASEAATINNDGLESQINYLLDGCMPLRDVEIFLYDALESEDADAAK